MKQGTLRIRVPVAYFLSAFLLSLGLVGCGQTHQENSQYDLAATEVADSDNAISIGSFNMLRLGSGDDSLDTC